MPSYRWPCVEVFGIHLLVYIFLAANVLTCYALIGLINFWSYILLFALHYRKRRGGWLERVKRRHRVGKAPSYSSRTQFIDGNFFLVLFYLSFNGEWLLELLNSKWRYAVADSWTSQGALATGGAMCLSRSIFERRRMSNDVRQISWTTYAE